LHGTARVVDDQHDAQHQCQQKQHGDEQVQAGAQTQSLTAAIYD
jgi:hypothetical protein